MDYSNARFWRNLAMINETQLKLTQEMLVGGITHIFRISIPIYTVL